MSIFKIIRIILKRYIENSILITKGLEPIVTVKVSMPTYSNSDFEYISSNEVRSRDVQLINESIWFIITVHSYFSYNSTEAYYTK